MDKITIDGPKIRGDRVLILVNDRVDYWFTQDAINYIVGVRSTDQWVCTLEWSTNGNPTARTRSILRAMERTPKLRFCYTQLMLFQNNLASTGVRDASIALTFGNDMKEQGFELVSQLGYSEEVYFTAFGPLAGVALGMTIDVVKMVYGKFRLSFVKGAEKLLNKWRSPAKLMYRYRIYREAGKDITENAIVHILRRHAKDAEIRPGVTRFSLGNDEILPLLDEARYSIASRRIRPRVNSADNYEYVVPMGRQIGENGQTRLMLVTESAIDAFSEPSVVTAFAVQ